MPNLYPWLGAVAWVALAAFVFVGILLMATCIHIPAN